MADEYDQGGDDSGSIWGLDSLKKYVAPFFPKPQEPYKADFADKSGDLLKKAGLEADSPQALLLKQLQDHVNSQPMPQGPPTGLALAGQIGLNAAGAGFLSRAGDKNPQRFTEASIADNTAREQAVYNANMGRFKNVGDMIIPSVTNAVQQAQARKDAADMLARSQKRLYNTPDAPPAAPGGPPGAASPPGGTAPAGPPPAAPGPPGAPPPAAPPAGAAAPPPAAPRPGNPGGDEPQYPLDGRGTTEGRSPIRFHMPDSALQADAQIQQALQENAARVASGISPKPATADEAMKQEANTVNGIVSKVIADDRAAWQASTAYKTHQQGQVEEQKGVIAKNQKDLGEFTTAGKAAYTNNNVVDMMLGAADQAEKSGNLGLGWGNTILGPINNVLERINAPHLSQGAYNTIKELSNRAAIESANEEVSSGRGPGQRIMQTFLGAVPSADMSGSGFRAAAAAIKAINTYHIAAARAAEQIMAEPGSHSNVRNLQAEVAKRAQKEFDVAVQASQEAMGAIKPKEGAAGGAPAAPLSLQDTQTAVAKIIADSKGKLSVPEAMDILDKQRAPAKPEAPAAGGAPGGGGAAPASGVPPRPEPGFKRRLWDFSYPEEAKRMDSLRKLRPDTGYMP